LNILTPAHNTVSSEWILSDYFLLSDSFERHIKKENGRLVIVVYAYNPSILDQDCGSKLAWAKSWQDPISTNKWDVVVHTCIPRYKGRCR
jgi:hypothetical protein